MFWYSSGLSGFKSVVFLSALFGMSLGSSFLTAGDISIIGWAGYIMFKLIKGKTLTASFTTLALCTFSKHAFLSFSDFKGLLFIMLKGIVFCCS